MQWFEISLKKSVCSRFFKKYLILFWRKKKIDRSNRATICAREQIIFSVVTFYYMNRARGLSRRFRMSVWRGWNFLYSLITGCLYWACLSQITMITYTTEDTSWKNKQTWNTINLHSATWIGTIFNATMFSIPCNMTINLLQQRCR